MPDNSRQPNRIALLLDEHKADKQKNEENGKQALTFVSPRRRALG